MFMQRKTLNHPLRTEFVTIRTKDLQKDVKIMSKFSWKNVLIAGTAAGVISGLVSMNA